MILFIAAISYWAIQNPQQAVDTGKDVYEAGDLLLTEVCPLDEKVLSSINESFIQNLNDEKAKELAQKIIDNTATDCDRQTFLSLLSEEERKRINLLDFACNLKDCGLGEN